MAEYIKSCFLIFFILITAVFGISNISVAEDFFDWGKRIDRYGTPAGHFEITPFPIDETMTSYSITNDEGTKTYYLGTKYYVNGKDGNDSNDGLSLADAKKTIRAAIMAAGSGNNTIIVRGPHDGWNGIYYESGLNPKVGADDAHRFMIVGYKQERPIIDGGNGATDIIRSSFVDSYAYSTIQRLKIQNSRRQGVMMGYSGGKRDRYFNMIDVWVYNCDNSASYAANTDGNIYLMNIDHGWIFHVTSERTYGHGIKYADGGDNAIIEWTVVKEAGYWSGIPEAVYWNNHAFGIHFSSVAGENEMNAKIRYNIVYDTLFHALQVRRAKDFSIHHNEFYHASRCWSFMTNPSSSCDTPSGNNPQQIYLLYDETSGDFYSNIVRQPGSTGINSEHMRIRLVNLNNPEISIYGNLFYDNDGSIIRIRQDNTGAIIKIYNNTFYGSNSSTLIDNEMNTSDVLIINNIIYQNGRGSCVEIMGAWHAYNNYYYPNGTRGVTLGEGEFDGDPQFVSLPSGAYDVGEAAISTNSLARDSGIELTSSPDLGKSFSSTLITRPQGSGWDIGAFEYNDILLTRPAPPNNLRIVNN